MHPPPVWGHSDFSHFDRGKPKASDGEYLAQAPEQKRRDKVQAVACLQSSGLSLNCSLRVVFREHCALLRAGPGCHPPLGK